MRMDRAESVLAAAARACAAAAYTRMKIISAPIITFDLCDDGGSGSGADVR